MAAKKATKKSAKRPTRRKTLGAGGQSSFPPESQRVLHARAKGAEARDALSRDARRRIEAGPTD